MAARSDVLPDQVAAVLAPGGVVPAQGGGAMIGAG
jgi:hypothetical protein